MSICRVRLRGSLSTPDMNKTQPFRWERAGEFGQSMKAEAAVMPGRGETGTQSRLAFFRTASYRCCPGCHGLPRIHFLYRRP
jgi:hypothetical protein